MKPFVWLILLLFFTSSALGQAFDLYVVDIGPNRGQPWQVIKYDENGQNPEVFINTELSKPQDILFLEDQGIALVSSLTTGRITRHNAETGKYIDDFATGIGQPTRMKVGPDKLLYVLQWQGNGRVWRYDLDGNFVDEFTSVGVSNSIGMDWDNQGNLYVASWDGPHVRKFDQNGNDLGLFATTHLQGPTNIWFDDSGDLLVMDWSGRVIRRYDSNGVFKSNFVVGLNEPEGIEFLDNGHFLVGNGGTSSVIQFDENGNYVKDFVSNGLGGLAKPNAVRIRDLSKFKINTGHSGAWFNPETSGQGQFIDVEPATNFIFLSWFTYTDATSPDPNEQQWYTAQGNYSDNSAELEIVETLGGQFDDPQAVNNTSAGTATVTFNDCEQGLLAFAFDDGRSGQFPMERVIPGSGDTCQQKSGISVEAVDINAGMDGAWFESTTSGQGFFIDSYPDPEGGNFIFVSWFTYGNGTASGQRWLTAQGGFTGSSAAIDVMETTCGSLNASLPTTTVKVGTMNIEFTDCNHAELTYSLDDGVLEGVIAITRVVPGSQALCEELAGTE
jgi:sugar lactone lactonase YvrE